MKYGLTVYGPFDDEYGLERLRSRMCALWPGYEQGGYKGVTNAQVDTAWQTMLNYPDFNSVEIVRRHNGSLVIHVYYSPVDVPEDADCVFHAKISPEGMYE